MDASGRSSGMAAAIAIRDGVDVQDVAISELREEIVKVGIPLDLPVTGKDAADASDEWRIDTTEE